MSTRRVILSVLAMAKEHLAEHFTLLRAAPGRLVWGLSLIGFTYVLAVLHVRPQPFGVTKKHVPQRAALSRVSPLKSSVLKPTVKPLVRTHVTSVVLDAGMTLDKVLSGAQLDPRWRTTIAKKLAKTCRLDNLPLGTLFKLHWKTGKDGVRTFTGLSFQESFARLLAVQRGEGDTWKVVSKKQRVVVKERCFRGDIQHSFYQDALKSGLSKEAVTHVAALLKSTLNLRRVLRKGDSFKVVLNEATNLVTGEREQRHCAFVELNTQGGPKRFFHYEGAPKTEGFFDEKGHLLREGAFCSPVVGGRLTSRFGYRTHPILRRRIFHRGVDFVAPKGSPVLAAFPGKVLRANRNGGYGRYVLIQHEGGYKTAYAHLDRYAHNIKPGTYVTAGQSVGYVGSSGLATGPHLHFEVLRGNTQINPLQFKHLPQSQLKGEKFKAFKAHADALKKRYADVERNVSNTLGGTSDSLSVQARASELSKEKAA